MDYADDAMAHEAHHMKVSLANFQNTRLSGEGSAYCEDCGEKIPAARKKAEPSAIRCVACQVKFES